MQKSFADIEPDAYCSMRCSRSDCPASSRFRASPVSDAIWSMSSHDRLTTGDWDRLRFVGMERGTGNER
eukprot:131191-Pyramimonas_sp.AAC.1